MRFDNFKLYKDKVNIGLQLIRSSALLILMVSLLVFYGSKL